MAVELFQGDCRDVLPTLREASVHCAITSPPYWGLRDYGCAGQIGLEGALEEHVEVLVGVFRAVKRVLRTDGTLWLNYGDCYTRKARKGRYKPGYAGKQAYLYERGAGRASAPVDLPKAGKEKDLLGLPWRVAFALQADGWWLRAAITLCKLNPLPEPVLDRPTNATEMLFLLTKAERYYYDAEAIRERTGNEMTPEEYAAAPARGTSWRSGGSTQYAGANKHDGGRSHPSGRNKRNWWPIASEPSGDAHFATFPTGVVKPCILAGTSEWGCCPRCGAPWLRQTEKQAMIIRRSERTHEKGRTRGSSSMLSPPQVATPGWAAACACGVLDTEPCTVLDPFAGSGTVSKVATSLGRHSVGIELSEPYLEIARRKNAQQGLML